MSKSISNLIRSRIADFPEGYPFATSEFLAFGSRPAVDQCLHRLVKAGVITRVARGVFVRAGRETPLPSVKEVLEVKAKATHRWIVSSGAQECQSLGLDGNDSGRNDEEKVFWTTGANSKLKVRGQIITLKRTSPRKAYPGKLGSRAIRALWSLGQTKISTNQLEKLRDKIADKDIAFVLPIMPSWMRQMLSTSSSKKRKRKKVS